MAALSVEIKPVTPDISHLKNMQEINELQKNDKIKVIEEINVQPYQAPPPYSINSSVGLQNYLAPQNIQSTATQNILNSQLTSFQPSSQSITNAYPLAVQQLSQINYSNVKPDVQRPFTTTDNRRLARERELEIEVVDLRSRIENLESQLDLKQEQIYQIEKNNVQSSFAKIEMEALDKLKGQLRETNHKIELYKIETEELIKQVDYT